MDTGAHTSGIGVINEQLRARQQAQESGMLQLGSVGRIWLDTGRVYLVEKAGGPPLHEVVFGANVGDLDELETAFTYQQDVAAQLAGRYPASRPHLERVLHEFGLNNLFELAVSGPTNATFEAGVVHPLGPHFAEPIDEVLDQVERRLDVWRNIAARIPSTDARFRLVRVLPGSDERVVSADEWSYLALLDGHHSVAALVDELGLSAFRVMSVLYRLILEGLIEEV